MTSDQDSKKVRYRISFFAPGEREGDSVDYDAETPFQTVSVGDEIGGLTFDTGGRPGSVGRVTKVVRTIGIAGSEIHDVTLVFSESVEQD